MRLTTGLLAALLLSAALAHADGPSVIDAPTAQARVAAGEITLIDIRSPGEWRKSGVPHGAKPITMHGRGGLGEFVDQTTLLLRGRKDRPVALICATGRRSAAAAQALRKTGFANVINVREGMFGNRTDGPGWLARRLPVDDCKAC